jgi:predicted double-glycine peptidase
MKVMLNKYPTRYLLMAMIYILVLTTDSDEATTSELPAYLQHDKACGPRCLLALIKIENQFMSHYDVNNIYQIIGKKPFSPTTLKDLKIGAQKLGFSAVGYKLKLNDLKKLNSYAILPIGRSEGTASDPLHFILINGVNDNFVSIVDTETFILHDFPLNKLEKLWGGYALALSLQENVTLPSKNNKSQSAKEESDTKYDGIKDFDIVDSGSMLQHSFVIRNETGRRCRLRIVSRSCSCISPEFGKTELEPNEETTLKLKLHVNL